jgi:aryl-alcohol dehydrogenase-like predicted oxidoreductase
MSASIVRTAGLKQVVPALEGTALSVIARSPLASGLLARDVTSWSAGDFRGDLKALDRAIERVKRVRRFGTPGDVSLRYLAQHEGITSVLLATTRLAHLNEDLQGLKSPPFSADEMRAIDEVVCEG